MWQQHVTEAAQPALAYWALKDEKKGKERAKKKGNIQKKKPVVGIQGIIKEMEGEGGD